jgi:hypothetical protein
VEVKFNIITLLKNFLILILPIGSTLQETVLNTVAFYNYIHCVEDEEECNGSSGGCIVYFKKSLFLEGLLYLHIAIKDLEMKQKESGITIFR